MADRTRPDWVDDELFPFESRFATIDGHAVHYVDEGSGPTLLFLHGNPTWSFVYRDVIRALRPRFRCIALDYPGFGLSTAAPGYSYLPEEHTKVVTAFVDALDLRQVTLVAHDWGGPIGLASVQDRRGVFDGLVLANTWGWPTSGAQAQLASHLIGGPAGRLLIRQFNLFVNAAIPAGHRLRKPTSHEMAHYRQAMSSHDRRHATAVLPGRITASRSFLAGIAEGMDDIASLPALIVWGDADIAFGARERQRWEQTLADSRTVIIEGAGHFVQSDAPAQFAAALTDWWSARDAPQERPGTPGPT
jgi:haloalkane dehalogenase